MIFTVFAGFLYYNYGNKNKENANLTQKVSFNSKDIFSIDEKGITDFLNTNKDSKDYIEKNKDFRIAKKEILTKDSILAGQSANNFKEAYQGLALEDDRYMLINLINMAGDKGLIAVLDFKEKAVIKAYGMVLINAVQK